MSLYEQLVSDQINDKVKVIDKRLSDIEKKLDFIMLQISDEEKWKEFLNQLNEGGRRDG